MWRRCRLEAGLRRHGLAEVDAGFDTSGKRRRAARLPGQLSQRGVLVCIGHGEGLDLTTSPDLIGPERAVIGSEYFCYGELPR